MTIKLKGTDGSVSLTAPADTSPTGSDITLTLPTTVGSAEQFLKNSGTAGELEFSNMVETSTGVGINQSSPSYELQVSQSGSRADIAATSNVSSGTASRFILGNSAGTARATFNLTGGGSETAYLGTEGSFPLYFQTNGAERMRLSGTGELFLNSTSQISNGKVSVEFNGTTHNGVVLKTTRAAVGTDFTMYLNSSGSVAGKITHNGSTTVSYTTSSDYRLKENVVAIADGITRVKQLAPKRFNFIEDGTDRVVDGFLAHEAQAVVPEAVTGTHNEVDEDDNPVYQGIDQSKLVPLLTAALQEAIGKIETLETQNTAQQAQIDDLLARITALEAAE